jgi:hypothetical protein
VNDRQQANKLLDRHKETKEFSYLDTTRALIATGDIEGHGSEGVDNEVQEEIPRSWDTRRFFMVVADIARFREKTRVGSNQ